MTADRRPDRLLAAPARAGGAALAAAVRALAAVRPAEKPMHPVGRVLRGRLERHGLQPATGVPFLDGHGTDEVVVRESKGVGLPDGLPDVHGLAIRVPGVSDGPADLLLTTNGWGPLTRFLLVPSAGTTTRPMTTIVPYRSPSGPLLVGARYAERDHVVLAVARPRSEWRTFADLHLEPVDPSDPDRDDPDLEFDAVLHELPGLPNYEWVRRLRAPAYRTARRSRR